MIVHFHSEVDIAELASLLPYSKIVCPARGHGRQAPPFLAAVETSDGFAHVSETLKGLMILHPGKVIALPHPRDTSTLPAEIIAVLKRYIPAVTAGYTMSDVLREQFKATGGDIWNPLNFL